MARPRHHLPGRHRKRLRHRRSSATIKSHHNVGASDYMKLQVVEPLRMLFKDEVRRVGREMGLDSQPWAVIRSPAPAWASASSVRSM